MDYTGTGFTSQPQGIDPISQLITLLVYITVGTVTLAGLWKVFVKAGHPGWKAVVPFYNTYVLMKIVHRPWWWLFLLLIPIANIIISIIVTFDIVKVFGKSGWFGVLLLVFPPIGIIVLGFDKSQYKGTPAPTPGTPPPASPPTPQQPPTVVPPVAPTPTSTSTSTSTSTQ